MPANPNAPLPAFGSLQVNGKNVKWEDYALTVDGDDPFFRSFAAAFMVNADFTDLPISSVIVQVSYKGPQGQGRAETYTFRKPEDIERFEAFLDGGTGEFEYVYTVNYRGESNAYKSPPIKSKSDVSINVGDLGIWKVDIDVGDINFDQVRQAQLKLVYQDGDIRRERQFTMTNEARRFQIREVIFKPRTEPWTYSVKYFLKDGREVSVTDETSEGEELYVNDPFSANRTVSIRTKGDFDNTIDTLFLDFVYVDDQNDYKQEKSFAFSAAGRRFEDWTFPVISERAGKLTYTGTIVYKDGRPPLAIAEKPVTSNTVLEGEDVLELNVELIPDLIDWSQTKLVTVTLSYVDGGERHQRERHHHPAQRRAGADGLEGQHQGQDEEPLPGRAALLHGRRQPQGADAVRDRRRGAGAGSPGLMAAAPGGDARRPISRGSSTCSTWKRPTTSSTASRSSAITRTRCSTTTCRRSRGSGPLRGLTGSRCRGSS